jgi:hypothetical protein
MFSSPHDLPPDQRPTMSAQEVSWHETIAGIRARKAADSLGCLPAAREAIAFASLPPNPLRPPITIGTLWAVEESERHGAELTGASEFADRALLAFTVSQPERALASYLIGDLADIRAGMLEAASRPAEESLAIERWFESEMARLKALAGGADSGLPGKKIPAGQSPS